jgi:hypothetical protein
LFDYILLVHLFLFFQMKCNYIICVFFLFYELFVYVFFVVFDFSFY